MEGGCMGLKAPFAMLLLLFISSTAAAGILAKWTFFIYMLADNDLEQYGLLDMEVGELMHLASPLCCMPMQHMKDGCCAHVPLGDNVPLHRRGAVYSHKVLAE